MPAAVDGPKPVAENDFRELSLLLPAWQLDAIAELARRREMNVGQLLRRLIGNMLHEMGQTPDGRL